MEPEEHCQLIGAILMNFQALETVLRCFLLKAHHQPVAFPEPGDTKVAHNYLTNWKSLNELIDEYNRGLKNGEGQYSLDRSVVAVRDAIAHGRLVTADVFPMTLWKFGRPKDGRVPIEFFEVLTKEWLVAKRNKLFNEKEKVLNLFKARPARQSRATRWN
jgi:hypothetical protein